MVMSLFTVVFLGLCGLVLSFELSLVGFMVILVFYLSSQLPLEEEFRLCYSLLNYDGLSLSLSVLTIFLTILMWLSSHYLKNNLYEASLYLFLMCSLMIILLVSFLTFNFLTFYFFFESSLIPTLMIIMGWGYQPERLQAGIYFMLYTLFASLPLLVSIFYIYSMSGSLTMMKSFFGGPIMPLTIFFVNGLSFSSLLIVGLSLFLVVAFLVKLPMFSVHLWLPKAHVEAPVAGSMILAGVLLKLGGYGICRVSSLFYSILQWLSPYIIGLSVAGMIYIGFCCCRLNDMKALVAYSSVAHMALVIGGLFSFYLWGVSGALMLMLSHGLVSSGLFCMVNLFYERLSSRSLFINSGLIVLFPGFYMLIFLLCCFNIAAPPSINLLSEIFLMTSILVYDSGMMLLFPLGSFLGAVFTFYMFSYSQHGSVYVIVWGAGGSRYIEFHSIILHLFPVLLLILSPAAFMTYL